MGWTGGRWIVWAGRGQLLCRPAGSDVALPCKKRTRRKKGWGGLCPWPLRCLNQILSERKERMLRLLSLGVPFSGGAALYL